MFALHPSNLSDDNCFPQMEEAVVLILAEMDVQASNYWLSRCKPLCYRDIHNHLDEELPRRCRIASFQ